MGIFECRHCRFFAQTAAHTRMVIREDLRKKVAWRHQKDLLAFLPSYRNTGV
jgi:hypothetical protein